MDNTQAVLKSLEGSTVETIVSVGDNHLARIIGVLTTHWQEMHVKEKGGGYVYFNASDVLSIDVNHERTMIKVRIA